MITSIIQALFENKLQPNMSDQEKKRQWIYDFLNAKLMFLCLSFTKQRKDFTWKSFLRKSWELNEKRKEGLLTPLAMAIKKDPHNANKKAR